MGKSILNQFNRGELSPRALARDDVDQFNNSGELVDNFIPVKLGPMVYRPGTEYIGDPYSPAGTTSNRALIPVTRSIGDTVQYEFQGTTMRPLIDGLPIPVSTDTIALTNETFASNSTGWTLVGSPVWGNTGVFTVGGSIQVIYGSSFYQTSGTITGGDKQSFNIQILYGPIILQIANGSSVGSDILEVVLYPGSQIIQFTPTSTTFTINFKSVESLFGDGKPVSYVLSCESLTSGNIELTVVDVDYRKVSTDVSADVLFIAMGKNYHPRIIRRIGDDSYTYEEYFNLNGPFGAINSSTTGLTQTDFTGEVTLQSDVSTTFSSVYNVPGRLYKLVYPISQYAETFGSTTEGVTDTIAIRGYGSQREIFLSLVGNGFDTGTPYVTVDKYDEKDTTWKEVHRYTSETAVTIVDSDDGVLAVYRVRTADIDAGTITVNMYHNSQALNGNARVLAWAAGNALGVNVYKSFENQETNTDNTVFWYPGAWTIGSYPQSVALYEGRLVWASTNRIDASVTDDYFNFDTEIPDATAAITKTIGFGPVENISWLESAGKLYMGLPTTEVLVRSNDFDEPLTPTNTNLKPGKGVGSKTLPAVAIDNELYFVSRDGKRIHELSQALNSKSSIDQMTLNPNICSDGIAKIAVTKNPEYRIWVLTETGELRVLLKDITEDVQAWSRVDIGSGLTVKDISVVPADGEDELWLVLKKGLNIIICKLAAFSATEPRDLFIRYTSPGATATGLSHLEGDTVNVWADGESRGDLTVSSGSVTLQSAGYTDVIVGLKYTAQYKSGKLGRYVKGSVLGDRKTVNNTGLIMQNYEPGSVQVGRDFDNLLDLPGALTGAIIEDYDEQRFGFNGVSDTDSRICIQATGPCEILALGYTVDTEDKDD